MWLFTKYGFYSAVCARAGSGQYNQPVDLQTIIVRARLRSHLEALQQRFPDLIGGCEIREFAHSDYAYRLFVPKAVWSQLLVELTSEMDYDNFKAEVAHHQGPAGKAYERALHKVWEVMHQLQQ
jgi:hypothetical protein